MDSLVGNLQTKIWHANSDPETNTNAAEIIGKSWHVKVNETQSFGSSGGVSVGESQSETFDYDVIPQEFTRLRKGSSVYGFLVDGIVFQNGRKWSDGKTALYAAFNQRKT